MSVKTIVSLFLVLVVSIIFLFFVFQELDKNQGLSEIHLLPQPDNEIRMMFVGDIMLHRGVEHYILKAGEGDYTFPFHLINDYLSQADFVFGNLESVISDQGSDQGGLYSFRADPQTIDGLIHFNAVSVANNHAFDYGRLAFEDNLKRLAEKDILFVGGGMNAEEAYSPKFLEIKGNKIALLGYLDLGSPSWEATENRSGVAWAHEEKIQEGIAKAQEADIVIVSFHYGEEYQKEPNERQRYLSNLAVSAGADLVIGHHPHVTQPVEDNIAFSLGNFIFDQKFSEETMQGLLLDVVFNENRGYNIKEVPVTINQYYQPCINQ